MMIRLIFPVGRVDAHFGGFTVKPTNRLEAGERVGITLGSIPCLDRDLCRDLRHWVSAVRRATGDGYGSSRV
jgi:hypothetical protein